MLSSSANLLHRVLCLFVFLAVLISFPTAVFQYCSKSDKRGWLTRWPPWSFANPMCHSDTLSLFKL